MVAIGAATVLHRRFEAIPFAHGFAPALCRLLVLRPAVASPESLPIAHPDLLAKSPPAASRAGIQSP
jgi:hypothetical protein